MPIYHIEHECNGHTEQSPHGVELAGLAEVTAYAIATARLFQTSYPASVGNVPLTCATPLKARA